MARARAAGGTGRPEAHPPADGDVSASDAPPPDREPRLTEASYQRTRSALLHARTMSLNARAAETVRAARAAWAERAAAWLARYGQRDALGVLVTHCAWCGRLRTAHGDRWRPSSAWRPAAAVGVRLSHGICPECEARHFPPEPGDEGTG